jgi:hypothetical protein
VASRCAKLVKHGAVVHLGERLTGSQKVGGSNPPGSTTSLTTDASDMQIGSTVKYLPFGQTLAGSVDTDKLFTGQRLDLTGLYYYGARYYDPTIGRFIN